MIARVCSAVLCVLALAGSVAAQEVQIDGAAVSTDRAALRADVLAWSLSLAPRHARAELESFADSVASVVDERGPVFAGAAGKRRTAALITAIAFRESSFELSAAGDGGKSLCWMQVQKSRWGSSVTSDPVRCISAGWYALRESLTFAARNCPAYPLAPYAGGPRGCDHRHAQWVSVDRFGIAKQLEQKEIGTQ